MSENVQKPSQRLMRKDFESLTQGERRVLRTIAERLNYIQNPF